jgi:hypothetical protein
MLVSTSSRIQERALFADEELLLDIVDVGNLGFAPLLKGHEGFLW